MVAATMPRRGRSSAPSRKARRFEPVDLRRAAYETVAQHCHFRGRAGSFQIDQRDDRLIVRGCVPSFYLKQLLQTALLRVEGVRSVDNQVNVVSCEGLSSVRDS